MWLRGRWLSCVGVMLVQPLCCEAQGRPRPGGRDSILDGTAIGFAAGAGFGIVYVSVVRDLVLDVGDYTSSALIFGGLGAAVGLGIDALCDRHSSAVGPRHVWRSDPGCHGRPPQFASSCDGSRVAILSFPTRQGISHDVCRLGDV